MRRLRIVGAFIAFLVVHPREARADATCDAAFEQSELLLRPSEGHLLEARAALRTCALPSCQPWMVDDCTKRLAALEERIPSVVFSAENARGVPVYDVRVLDGARELTTQIDGRAIEMDPGPHELVAERAASRVPLSVVVIEGKKAQQVVFAFHDAPIPPPEPPPRPPQMVEAHPWARPLAGGLLLGGIVGLGLGAGFGVSAIAKQNEANCDGDNVCDGPPLESARSAARASTISFLVGGALVLGGAFTFFAFGRTRVQASAHRVQVEMQW